MEKCFFCKTEKELNCCNSCATRFFMERITESFQGDTAFRFKFLLDERLDRLEEKIEKLFKDKYIVLNLRGKKIK